MRPIALLFAAVIALLVTACGPTITTFRYRLNVELETPSGPMMASSVIEVIHRENHFGMGQGGKYRNTIHGVAPMFDLGDRGTLIVALEYNGGGTTGKPKGYHEIPKNIDSALFDIDKGEYRPVLFEPFELSQYEIPQFIWIRAKESDPLKAMPLLPREFEAHIGKGFRLKSVMVEPTNDPVSERIEPAPEWLENIYRRYAKTRREGWKPGKRGQFYLQSTQIETGRPLP